MASHFACQGDFRDFHFPRLAKLNNKFAPFPWANNNKRICFLSHDEVEEDPVLYHGPPPLPTVYSPPPPISTLVASIIDSADQLFFMSHLLGNPSEREWRLIGVVFLDSMALYPSCLQDSRFLVKFYTLHYDDIQFNAINQWYWL